MNKRLLLVPFVLLVAVSVYLVIQQLSAQNASNKRAENTAGHGAMQGIVLDAQPTGGDFVLQTVDGEFDLKDYRNRLVLIYFGYTFCPDICPTNLALMAQTLNALTDEELKQVQPVFISLDPGRDTLQHLKQYSQYFHPDIIGMTADEQTVAKVAGQYGAAYKKVFGESEGGYLIDHSSFTYLVDRSGKLVGHFAHATDPLQQVERIRELLKVR